MQHILTKNRKSQITMKHNFHGSINKTNGTQNSTSKQSKASTLWGHILIWINLSEITNL